MKKKLYPVLILFLLLSATTLVPQAIAQNDDEDDEVATQSIFFELLGAGGIYSFNYDTRFQDRPDGVGARIGLSYLATDEDAVFSIPVMLNYLLGKNGNYFEVGLGATYINVDFEFLGGENESAEQTVFGTMTFGYRLQPVDGGFQFRAGVAPIFTREVFIPYWPYLSFGYAF